MVGARHDEPLLPPAVGRRLVLASASPRRRALLEAEGLEAEGLEADGLEADGLAFDVEVAHVDETPPAGLAPRDVAIQIARRKAAAVAATRPRDVILAADTVVVASDGTLLGKPRDADHARAMLRALSDSRQQVITGVAIRYTGGETCFAETTTVVMRAISDAEIDAYVASGEPFGKAGAYAIQETGDRFVIALEGSFSNVVGLPVESVRRALAELRMP